MMIRNPHLTNYKNFVTFENVFNDKECEFIKSLGWEWNEGLTGNNTTKDVNIRNSNVFWIHQRQDLIWIWERLEHFIQKANSHVWHMEITKFMEPLQLTKYKKAGHYNWHVDHGNNENSHRKLSCVVNLTDPNEYKNGGTIIQDGNKSFMLPKNKGTLNIFPSYILHKAKKIKKGTRMTLICWVGGSHYR
jgi:PKHD-type hydroxylase